MKAKLRRGLVPIFGGWYCDTSAPVVSLNYGTSKDAYWVPLAEMRTSGDIFHWIAHIAQKAGCYSAADVGDFVRSLNFLFDGLESGDPTSPELRAVQTIYQRSLPCEDAEVSDRAARASAGNTEDSQFKCYSVAALIRAEADVVSKRHASGRYALAAYGRKLLARAQGGG
jgi:hypothetical protein